MVRSHNKPGTNSLSDNRVIAEAPSMNMPVMRKTMLRETRNIQPVATWAKADLLFLVSACKRSR